MHVLSFLMEPSQALEVDPDETLGEILKMYISLSLVSLRGTTLTKSAMMRIFSRRAHCSLVSLTFENVSPITAISMFRNTRFVKKVEQANKVKNR